LRYAGKRYCNVFYPPCNRRNPVEKRYKPTLRKQTGNLTDGPESQYSGRKGVFKNSFCKYRKCYIIKKKDCCIKTLLREPIKFFSTAIDTDKNLALLPCRGG